MLKRLDTSAPKQTNGCAISTISGLPKNTMTTIGRCTSVILALLLLAGCSSLFSRRPSNRIIPKVSFEERMRKWNNVHGNKDPSVEWMEQFAGELKGMNGWAPDHSWFNSDSPVLKTQIERVIQHEHYPPEPPEYASTIRPELSKAAEYFFLSSSKDERGLTNFIQTDKCTEFMTAAGASDLPSDDKAKALPGKLNLIRLAADMLLRIDDEHQTLLVQRIGKYNERDVRCFSGSPRMLSRIYPVGVSLSVVTPPEDRKSSAKTNAQSLVTINNYVGGTSAPPTTVKNKSPDKTPAGAKPLADFSPNQNVILSLSTVLNSADVLDRIEYVSTFIYVYPYPQPANGDVSLNDELWKWFFVRQLPRPQEASTDTVVADLNSSFDHLRVRFRNVTTTVVTKDVTLGSVTRTTEDDLGATLGASIPTPVVPAATVNPSVNTTTKVASSTAMQIMRQLDQRSAYVSQDGSFLRITQRGMSSVNLNGRFNEQVQLYIPSALDPLYVIEPVTRWTATKESATTNKTTKESATTNKTTKKSVTSNAITNLGFTLQAITEPMYSRVDAVVVSVVVVRHPAKLRRSSQETFGLSLEDAADEDFIVGLARPSKVELWKWQRQLFRVYSADIDFTTTKNEPVYFDCPSLGLYEARPLRLADFDVMQSLTFVGQIANAIRTGFPTNTVHVADGSKNIRGYLEIGVTTNCFISVTDPKTKMTIRLGLKNEPSGELRGFSPLKAFFPSYRQDVLGDDTTKMVKGK